MAKKSSVKKSPFAKRQTVVTPVVVALLFALNFVYAYAIGLPLPRMIVASYVESIEALGDAQVASYELMGSVVVATLQLPAHVSLATPSVVAPTTSSTPEPLLLIAPNQIR